MVHFTSVRYAGDNVLYIGNNAGMFETIKVWFIANFQSTPSSVDPIDLFSSVKDQWLILRF